MTLVSKLAEVMAHADRIPKNGHNSAQGYDYATAADVLAEVRKELANRRIFVTHKLTRSEWRICKTKNGEVNVLAVYLTLTAHDGETGEKLDFAETMGEGMDYGDKQSGKALTGAMKYAILNGFMIPTGDDPENDAVPPPRQRQRPEPAGDEPPASNRAAPTHFPTFGPAPKGAIAGADPRHLIIYLEAARKALANPEKKRFHASESALIGAIEAEMRRQNPKPDTQKPGPSSADVKAAAKGLGIVDVLPGENEEHARERGAGVYFAKALKAGSQHGWDGTAVANWLRDHRKRGGRQEVTAEDAELFCRHLGPPADEPGSGG